MSNKENKSKRVVNTSKISAIAERVVHNLDSASSYNLKRFKIIKNCFIIFDLFKLEAICIILRKLKL